MPIPPLSRQPFNSPPPTAPENPSDTDVVENAMPLDASLGERVAAKMSNGLGSWTFLILQNLFFLLYILINVLRPFIIMFGGFDQYPFQALNLLLSFQAAETGPVLMIAQNMTARRDRREFLALRRDFDTMALDHRKMHSESIAMHEKVDELVRDVRLLITVAASLPGIVHSESIRTIAAKYETGLEASSGY